MSEKFGFKPDESRNNAWLISFGDLVSLLVCFFVILYATINTDNDRKNQKLVSATENINNYFNKKYTFSLNTQDLEYLSTLLENTLKEYYTILEIKLNKDPTAIILTIDKDSLISSIDDNKPTPDLIKFFNLLTEKLRLVDNKVKIVAVDEIRSSITPVNYKNQLIKLTDRVDNIKKLFYQAGYEDELDIESLIMDEKKANNSSVSIVIFNFDKENY